MPETTPPPADAPTDPPTPTDDGQQPKPTAQQKRDDSRFEKLTDDLKTTKTERDQLRDRVTAYHRRMAEAMVATALAVPKDLWDVGGITVDELLTDGEVNAEKVATRVKWLLAARPGLAVPAHRTPPLPGPGA